MAHHPQIGVIGGSGLYEMPGLEETVTHDLETPYGKPSAPIVEGTLVGKRVAFLARHGVGHSISPTDINYRANIYAMKSIGVEQIVSVSACGSLREDYVPGDIVIPDQLFDFTRDRERSFFNRGMVAHISVADPFCPVLSTALHRAVETAGDNAHPSGAFITIEGPRFSTRAESNVYRSWGMAIIGMTTSPEAFLAREAEICYSVMAHVTDYDVWHISEEPVTVEMVVRILNQNTQTAQEAIRNLVRNLPLEGSCDCGSALKDALITNPGVIPPETYQRLAIFLDKYLQQ